MPNLKSAFKRMKTSADKRARNRSVKSSVNTIRRKFFDAVASGDKAAAEKCCQDFFSSLDKAAKKGILKANNASRRKSRAAAQLASMSKKA